MSTAAHGDPAEWKRRGFDEAETREWRAEGFSAYGAYVWRKAGFSNAHTARLWFEVGADPATAWEYRQKNVLAEVGAEFLAGGILPEDLDKKGTPVAGRTPVAWSDVFSRSQGARQVYFIRRHADPVGRQRVAQALRNLDAPANDAGGSMFSSYYQSMAFLDGGIYRVDAYGFGRISGTWVLGNLALALVCDRAGLTRPRFARTPDAPTLRHKWERQRREQWAALESRTSAILQTEWIAGLDSVVTPTPTD